MAKKLLLVFMGGDRNLDQTLVECKKLAGMFQTQALLTKSAQNVIGEAKVRQAGISQIILDDGRQSAVEISNWPDVLAVPVMTLNGLSKLAALQADSLHTNVIIGCLERNIPVIAARDSVWCSCHPEPQAGSPLFRKVEELVSCLRSIGVKISNSKNLTSDVTVSAGVSPGTKKFKVTIGSAGKAFEPSRIPVTTGGAGKITEGPIPEVTYGTAGKVFTGEIAKFGPIIDDTCPAFKEGSECLSCGRCIERKQASTKAIIDAGADRVASTSHAVASAPGATAKLAKYIDHTLLKANATQEEIGKLCEEARKYMFASVCVNPAYVQLCAQILRSSGVRVCTVVGFPLGATTPTVKAIETRDAVANGADEIDMVINVGALKSGNYQMVLDDIKAVREACRGKIQKVIIETAYLTREEKIKACLLSKEAGADFVKTSTGFGPSGATVEDIRLMRETVGPSMGVKAAGGIRTTEDAKKMVEAGATRIGASASISIVTEKGKTEGKH
jgi:deoxyribose-phosphate aldolase